MKFTRDKVYSNQGNPSVLAEIKKKGKVLDIGFGNGDNARILKNQGHVIDGITLSPHEAENVNGIIDNVYIYNLEEGLPKLISTYDYIICSHVLEHIAYPEKLLMDIKKYLKQDGKLIVALPNLMHYRFRFELLKGNFYQKESGIWDYTHLRWYTFSSGREMLLRNGFKIEKAYVDGDIPLLSYLKFIPKLVRSKIYLLLAKISSGFFGGQLIYVCKN